VITKRFPGKSVADQLNKLLFSTNKRNTRLQTKHVVGKKYLCLLLRFVKNEYVKNFVLFNKY